MTLPSLKFPKITAKALAEAFPGEQALPKLEQAPPKKEEEGSLFKTLARIVLPRSVEIKLGLTEPDLKERMWEQEGARSTYYREKRFEERYKAEITEQPTIPSGYKEPGTFFGQLYEGVKSGYMSTIKPTVGYLAESFGREIGSPQMLEWGEEAADRATIEVLKNPQLLAPESMKPFFKGGIVDQRWYGRMVGETSAFIGTVFGATLLGGLLGGPVGAKMGAYGSVFAIEKANSYRDFVASGIPTDEAGLYSNVYGVISSAIENAFGIAPAKIGSFIFTRKLREVPLKSFQSFLKKEIPKIGFKILRTSFEEGSEEVAQELTSNLIKKYYDTEGQKLGENLAESFAQGFFASIPFGAAHMKGVKVPPVGLTIEEVGAPKELEQIDAVIKENEKVIKLGEATETDLKYHKQLISARDKIAKGQSLSSDEKFVKDLAMDRAKKIKPEVLGEPLYHGGIEFDITKITDEGISLTKDRKIAEEFGKVQEVFLDKNAKILKITDSVNKRLGAESAGDLQDKALAEARKQKYDAVDFGKFSVGGEAEIRIINPAVIKTEQQLKPISKFLPEALVKKPAPFVRKRETTLLKERIMNLARGARMGRVATKEEIKDVQTKLLEMLDKSELDRSDKAKFGRAIKNIQTQEQLGKELPVIQERIEALTEASDIRAIKNRIEELLKKTAIKMTAGKPVGKFTPAAQKVLDLAREAIRMTSKEAEVKIIDNLLEHRQKTMPIEVAIQNRILSMNVQGPKGLRKLLEAVAEIKETGKMGKALKDFNIQEQLDREKNYLIDVVTDYKGIAKGRQTTGKEKLDFKTRAKQSLMSLGQNFILSWRGLMQVLDWHTQVDKKTLADKYSVLKQESKYKELQEEYIGDFNQMFAEVYNIPMETTKEKVMLPLRINAQIGKLKKEVNLGTFENTVKQKVEIKLTRDEMIKRYMEFQDPTLVDSFIDGNNYSEDIKDAIRAELTNQEKALAEKELEIYRDQYDKINPLYRKMYGVDLPFNQFYSPIMREGYKIDLKDGFQTFLDEASYRKAVTSKSFITRIKSVLPIARQGSLEALDRHITQTNYFIAWSEKIRQLDSIFADSRVREVVKEEFGGSLLNQIITTIEDLAYNRRIRGDMHKSVNWFRQKFTLGALMLKPALAVKQMVSTVAYLEKLSSIEFTTGIIDFWRHPIRNYQTMAKESTFIRTRGKGGEIERDIRAAMKADVYKRFSTLHSFWNMAMMNIRLGDKGAIITGSWALRRAKLKKGASLTETIREYEEFSAETQQSADISQLSAVQKGGTFSVLFTMFKSSQRQYLAKEVNAIKSLFQKGGISPKNYFENIRKVARVLAIYHVLLPVLFQWVANFGGWDEDDRKEYLRAGLLGSLNGLFLFGDIVDGIVRAAMGLKTWPQEVPIATIGKDLEQAVKKIDMDDITAEDVKDALFELSEAGNSLGIPVQYVKNFNMGLKEISEGDVEKGIGLLLGWSAYYLKEKKGKVPSGIKTEGAKLPSLKFRTPGGLPSLKFPKLK